MSGILLVTDHTRGTFSALSAEMIALAAKLRAAGCTPLRVIVIGSHMRNAAESLNVVGVDEIVIIERQADEFDAALYEAIALTLAEQFEPNVVLIGHSANGMAYAGGLAVALGAGFAADVFDVANQQERWLATRSGFGNKVNVTLDFNGKCVCVFTVRGGSFKPSVEKGGARLYAMSCEAIRVSGGWEHEQFIDPANEGVDVSKSEFILAIGRGIQDEKNVERFATLAARLGATLACSRPVADSGWLPKSRQVGFTGKPATGCKVYVALGISGAVQHLWGMKHIETIIAINSDKNAPIFDVATYGYIGDLFQFAEALEQLIPGQAA